MKEGFLYGVHFALGVFAAAIFLVPVSRILRDPSPIDAAGQRSGVEIVMDYETGVQYLAAPLCGITPRLDADGNAMRIEK